MICENCGATFAGWQGQCSVCAEWGTIVEQEVAEALTGAAVGSGSTSKKSGGKARKLQLLREIPEIDSRKAPTGIPELDRVLGEGLQPSGVVLLTGEPGVGKSTLLLQLAAKWGNNGALYISAEESLSQVSARGRRLKGAGKVNLLSSSKLEDIIATIEASEADLVIIDSIQTIYSEGARGLAGGISQVKHCSAHLVKAAKTLGKSMVIVGHINKEGAIAGPKVLEHLVDVVINFTGEPNSNLRMLRSFKNRYGPTDEVGIFSMEEDGLHSVTNPGEYFLPETGGDQVGLCRTIVLEGQRPLLLEVQALAVPTSYPYPKRVAEGVSSSRLQLIIAILSKHVKLKLFEHDIFIKISQGLKVNDPGVDLAIALGIYSSLKGKPLPMDLVAFAELSLTGQVIRVGQDTKRKREAKALGYKPFQIKTISQIKTL